MKRVINRDRKGLLQAWLAIGMLVCAAVGLFLFAERLRNSGENVLGYIDLREWAREYPEMRGPIREVLADSLLTFAEHDKLRKRIKGCTAEQEVEAVKLDIITQTLKITAE